ncbi:MAG: hypothetical protein JJ974_02660 [Phycisphaerales bacterium]|nr:hypothetical protein [Phycisphaerales bacterium]
MDEGTRTELERLVSRRIDPRKGVSPTMGTVRWSLGGVFIAGYIGINIAGFQQYAGLMMLAALAAVFICWLIPLEIRRATRKRAERHDNFLCPWCRYALTSLPDEGVCPECGSRYKKSVCQMLYQCAYRPYQPTVEELKARETEAWTEAIRLRDQES